MIPTKKLLATLKVPMMTEFKTEEDFDIALFNGLRRCLFQSGMTEKRVVPHTNHDNIIVFKCGVRDKYAVGIARQVHVAAGLWNNNNSSNNSNSNNSSNSNNNNNNNNNNNIQLDVPDSVAGGSAGNRKGYVLDHCSCLLERQEVGGSWKVRDCYSLIGLNANDSNCQDFDQSSSVDVGGKQAALGDVILDTITYVLQYHARRGERNASIPWAVLAGNIKKPSHHHHHHQSGTNHKSGDGEQQSSPSAATTTTTTTTVDWTKKVRRVAGSIQIPEACGDSFSYSIHDLGHFCETNTSNNKNNTNNNNDAIIADEISSSIEKALSVYLETILFGLKVAITVQKNLTEASVECPIRPPISATGRILKIGKVVLENHSMQLVASPIPGANPVASATTATELLPTAAGNHRHHHHHNNNNTSNANHFSNSIRWKVSEGDLFRGTLNVRAVLKGVDSDKVVSFTSKNKKVPVLIKVTSVTAHNPLIKPPLAFAAIQSIKDNDNDDDDAFQELKHVIHAVIQTGAGIITVLTDLSVTENYRVFQLSSHPQDQLHILWRAFASLVKRVLLPMARIGVVHPSIQPGLDDDEDENDNHDDDGNGGNGNGQHRQIHHNRSNTSAVVSNLWYKADPNGRTATLHLMDYDNLVHLHQWDRLETCKYNMRQADWDATTFVWWQSVAVAYAWSRHRRCCRRNNNNNNKKNGVEEDNDEGGEKEQSTKAKLLPWNLQTLMETLLSDRERDDDDDDDDDDDNNNSDEWLPSHLRNYIRNCARQERMSRQDVEETLKELTALFL